MAANSDEKARALEQCERDLDLAIERLVNLRLDPEDDAGEGAGPDDTNNAAAHHALAPAPAEKQSAVAVASGGGSSGSVEWVERLMEEMSSAGAMGDARARAARLLEDFGASVAAAASRAERKLRDVALRENVVLKKAVLVQYRLDKEKEAAHRELQRQLAGCQQRVRNLETDNYALSMYLRRAQPQRPGSITGRFHPEVF
ncbi:hypothetical protein BAE44_0012468 [Dichanthelium oligosanthes]|uniref:Uncharacterized protein n=1 Tax=Dichanthelium oligosanthes TaxID=888268 RepID=A0A1E5VN07_9POAL|nr:hypothetical protein BAE44_0012468 [Dichanthelium oligosanthes]